MGETTERLPHGGLLRSLTVLAWAFILAGVGLLAWSGWLLWGTGVATAQSQQALVADFSAAPSDLPAPSTLTEDGAAPAVVDVPDRGDRTARLPDAPPTQESAGGGQPFDPTFAGPGGDAVVPPGEAVALLGFSRPGSERPLVAAGWLAVVEGTSVADLRDGPGRYLGSSLPGEPGNFAVAGHRTTYGAPFGPIGELVDGDLVHVVDLQGVRFTYRVVGSRIVSPEDTWVIGDDPLGTGTPTLTLTTCHPKYSARQRLVVFAELV